MTEARRPLILPKTVTTPSAGVSLPLMAGETLACVARTPSSVNVPVSNRRSSLSRTVSLPSACCLATASAPPISSAFRRRAWSSSTSSFIPMEISRASSHLLGLDQVIDDEVGERRRAADHRQHRRDLAPVVGGVIRHVLEQRPQGQAERLALGAPVLDDAIQVGRREGLDERLLLLL